MFGEQYIVTAIHKNTLIQHLVRGSFREAERLANGFRMGPFRGGAMEGSILELTNKDVSMYLGSKHLIAERDLNKDMYIVQFFVTVNKEEYDTYCDIGWSKEELNEILNGAIPDKSKIIVNKASYTEITRIDKSGNETRVLPMEHTYHRDAKTVEFHYEPVKIKL